MKKAISILAILSITIPLFAQRIYSVGILPFEAKDGSASAREAEEAAGLVIAELLPCTTLTLLTGSRAESADYIVRGQIEKRNNLVVLSATTTERNSGRIMNTSKEEARSLEAVSVLSFCAQIVEYVPYPSYLIGRWRSTIDMIDGPVICIMEFRADRTVLVERFDTWEHDGKDILKYQAIGTGTVRYGGYHLGRSITVNNQRVNTDASMNIDLTLEDALPKYETISRSGMRVVFDESKNGFELVNSGLPCGDNRSGPSVYPGENVYYTKFTKIQ